MVMPRSLIPKPDRDRAYYERNKERIRAYKAEHYKSNRLRERGKALMIKYGISYEEYRNLSAEQNDCCKLCGRHESEDRDGVLHVDHDHATGVIRGLLCSQCNVALGLLQESPELIRRAAEYVARLGALDRRMAW